MREKNKKKYRKCLKSKNLINILFLIILLQSCAIIKGVQNSGWTPERVYLLFIVQSTFIFDYLSKFSALFIGGNMDKKKKTCANILEILR